MTSLRLMSHNSGMANDNKTIQRIIDERIAELGTSRTQVQVSAKVGSTYIRDLGRGQSFDSRAVTRIARVLGLAPADVMGIELPTISTPSTDDIEFFSEPDVRRAVMAATRSTSSRDPNFLADLVMTFLKAEPFEVSGSTSEPDIHKTG